MPIISENRPNKRSARHKFTTKTTDDHEYGPFVVISIMSFTLILDCSNM